MFQLPDLKPIMEVYKGLDTQKDILDPADLLITFPLAHSMNGPNPVAGSSEVDITYEELTALCPWTDLPDQGKIKVSYTPKDALLELKSFKYYLLSFRDMHISQEHLAQKIHHDLTEALKPVYLSVELDYMPRGGLHTIFNVS